MAGGRNVRAGGAFLELFLKDDKFRRGLDNTSRQLKATGRAISGMGRQFAAAGAVVTGPLVAAVKVFADAGDAIHKMSIRTRVGAESLSELKFAAEQSGTSIESLGAALFRMQRRTANAALETGPAVRALEELGIEAAKLSALNPEDQMLVIADALKEVGDEGRAAQFGFEIFGDNFKELAPLLGEGREGIEALKLEARELGLMMSAETANSAAAFSDSMNRAKQTLRALAIEIGAALGPSLGDILTSFAKSARAAIDWARDNRGLVLSVFTVAAGVTALGTALIAMGAAFTLAGVAVQAIVPLLGVGLVAALLRAANAGGQVSDFLEDRFGGLLESTRGVFGAIGRAMAAGEMRLAADVLWAGIRVAWVTGTNQIKSVWNDAVAFVLEVWNNLGANILTIWETVAHKVRSAFRSVSTWILDQFEWVLDQLTRLQEALGIDTDIYGFDQAIGGAALLREEQRRADEEHLARLAKIEKARQSISDEIQSGAAVDPTALAEAEAAAAEARAALDAAMEAVEALPAAGRKIADLELPDLEDVTAAPATQATAAGTFRGDLASAIFGAGENIARKQLKAQEAIEEAAEKTARNTERIIGLWEFA